MKRPVALGIACVALAAVFSAGFVLTEAGAVSVESVVVPITPCRLIDTRPAPDHVGEQPGALGEGETATLNVTGTHGGCTIPGGATGIVTNVTIVNPTAPSYLTLFPGDAPLPVASNLNYVAGQPPTPNQVSVGLSGTGAVKVFNKFGSVDVIIDITAYLIPGPSREQTRTVTFTGRDLTDTGAFQSGTSNGCTVDLTGRAGRLSLDIPVGASILNVTAVVFDESAASVYTATLRRFTTSATGDAGTTLASADNAAQNLVIHTATKDLTPPVTETVDVGERFEVRFDDGTPTFGNGLCYVSVTYRITANVAAAGADHPETNGDSTPIECERAEDCRVETP